MRLDQPVGIVGALVAALVLLVATPASAQAILGTCASCSSDSGDPNCGPCMLMGDACFAALPAANLIDGAFQTNDVPPRMGNDPTLNFAHLVGGMAASASDYMRAVNTGYNGRGALFYGTGMPAGFCGSSSAPAPAYADPSDYVFSWDTVPEDAYAHLDCWNGEIDRYYVGEPPHSDGDRVCDGEQDQFIPSHGAIFDLGGEGNRVAIFPYTDHPPLPCESFEYSIWLSDDPNATEIADPSSPDPTKWNPAQIVRAFLQGWIPDQVVNGQPVSTDARHPNLSNPTQEDGIVQVFALPCGITFRYASVVAGNNGTPSAACTFYSFDSELDAALGLNEDDTAICPDADGDGYRAASCGGTDCDDTNPNIHPGAYEDCSFATSVDCTGMVPQCPTSTSCFGGFCAPACIEGACATGFSCATGDAGLMYCLPSACVGVTCPVGQICGPMGCQDPCAGAVCPVGMYCINGNCQDPCQGYACPTNQHCAVTSTHAPSCVPDCTCLPCTGTGVCDMSTGTLTSGHCLAPGCDTVRCLPPSTPYCFTPTAMCIAPCDGVICPLSQTCDPTMNQCVRDLCFGVACQSSYVCQGGMCIPATEADSGIPTMDGGFESSDSGTVVTNHGDGGMDGTTGPLLNSTSTGGCGCEVPGGSSGGLGGWSAAVMAMVMVRRRRKV